MKRVLNLDWLPIEYAERYLKPGSGQIAVIYKPAEPDQCHIEYSTSNPDYVIANAEKQGYTEFAIIVN